MCDKLLGKNEERKHSQQLHVISQGKKFCIMFNSNKVLAQMLDLKKKYPAKRPPVATFL